MWSKSEPTDGVNNEPHLVSLHERTCSTLLITSQAMESCRAEVAKLNRLGENLIESLWKPGSH